MRENSDWNLIKARSLALLSRGLKWMLKWAFQIKNLSVVFSLHCKLFKFSTSPEPIGQFQPNLSQIVCGWPEWNLFTWRVHPSLMGDVSEMVKVHWQHFKIFFSKPLAQFQSNFFGEGDSSLFKWMVTHLSKGR